MEHFPCKSANYSYKSTSSIHEKGLKIFIPSGKKCFAWFHLSNGKPTCTLLCVSRKLNKKSNKYMNEFYSIKNYYVSFESSLATESGTVIFGTLCSSGFICETLYYWKGKKVEKESIPQIMRKLKYVLEHCIRNTNVEFIPQLDMVNFYLPVMSYSRMPLLDASNLAYDVYGIVDEYGNIFKLETMMCDLVIHSNLENDIYGIKNTNQTLLINDFKTSHFMNKKFNKQYENYRVVEKYNLENSENYTPFLTLSSTETEEINPENHKSLRCIYIPEKKKWKPYMMTKRIHKELKNNKNHVENKKIYV